MSRKKGVSLEEKRQRILHIYHDSKDVFNLKEVEKIGAKAGVGAAIDSLACVCSCCCITCASLTAVLSLVYM